MQSAELHYQIETFTEGILSYHLIIFIAHQF